MRAARARMRVIFAETRHPIRSSDPPEASIGLEDAPEDPIAEEVSDEEEDLGEEGTPRQ